MKKNWGGGHDSSMAPPIVTYKGLRRKDDKSTLEVTTFGTCIWFKMYNPLLLSVKITYFQDTFKGIFLAYTLI